MKDYDELKRKLTEKMDFEIVLKKEIEDYK